MICQRRNKSFPLVVGFVDVNKRRKRSGLKCFIDTRCDLFHVFPGKIRELSPLLFVGLIVDTGKPTSQNLEILIINVAVSDALKQLL